MLRRVMEEKTHAERQQDSIVACAYEAFADAPRINAPLANLDLDRFLFRLHGFREMHLEHAVLEIGGHVARIRIL